MALRNVLFDLDGTLTDSSPGIVRSLQHALGELGHDVPTFEELVSCVGPDIRMSFGRLLETEDRTYVERALGIYRARYAESGIFECRVYEGIPEALEEIAARGLRLWVATSKPLPFARQVVEHFGLDRYFVDIHGPALDGYRSSKPELLAHLLSAHELVPAETIMVGDREHDVEGARGVGIRCVAVTYGYGDREELERAAPELLCSTPSALPGALGYLE